MLDDWTFYWHILNIHSIYGLIQIRGYLWVSSVMLVVVSHFQFWWQKLIFITDSSRKFTRYSDLMLHGSAHVQVLVCVPHVCTDAYMHTNIYVCTYEWIHMALYKWMYVCIYAYACVCVYVCARAYSSKSVYCMCLCVCRRVRTRTCTYAHTCISTHTYTKLYKRVYTPTYGTIYLHIPPLLTSHSNSLTDL